MSTSESQGNQRKDQNRSNFERSDCPGKDRTDCPFDAQELFQQASSGRPETQKPGNAGKFSVQLPEYILDKDHKGEVTAIAFSSLAPFGNADKGQGKEKVDEQGKDKGSEPGKDKGGEPGKDKGGEQGKDKGGEQDKDKVKDVPKLTQEQLTTALTQESIDSENKSLYRARNGDTPSRDVGCASTVTNIIFNTLEKLGVNVPYKALHTNRVREIEGFLQSPELAKAGITVEQVDRSQVKPGDIVIGMGHKPDKKHSINANHSGLITKIENDIAYVANNHSGVVKVDNLDEFFSGYKQMKYLRLKIAGN